LIYIMLEESRIIFKVRLVAPVPTKKFDSGAEKWAAHIKASPDKIIEGLNKSIDKWKDNIKEKARSEGITEDEVLKKYPMFSKTLEDYQRSKEKVEKALIENEAGYSKFGDGVARGRKKYDRMTRESYYPLYGSRKDGVKGLIFLGLRALCGDRQLRKYLKPRLGKIITGKPVCICPPENLKDFGKEMRRQIAGSGAAILEHHGLSGDISEDILNIHSRQLNRWANRYQSAEFAPFEPGGESHIDFIVVEIPDPARPGQMMKWLGLDIQVSGKE